MGTLTPKVFFRRLFNSVVYGLSALVFEAWQKEQLLLAVNHAQK